MTRSFLAVLFVVLAGSAVYAQDETARSIAPSYVADTIRAHFPVLGIAGDTIVTPIGRTK